MTDTVDFLIVHWAYWIPILAVVGGFWLLRRGWNARAPGLDRRCRKCDYILKGVESANCPECGSPLTARNVTRTEPWKRIEWLLIGGLIVVGAGNVLLEQVRQADWYAWWPTAWVLDDLENDIGGWRRPWDELQHRAERRGLTEVEQRRLVAICLEAQAAKAEHRSLEPMLEYLAYCHRREQLRADEQDRFFGEMVKLSLRVRPTVVPGWRVPYQIVNRGCMPQSHFHINLAWSVRIDGEISDDIVRQQLSAGLPESVRLTSCDQAGAHQIELDVDWRVKLSVRDEEVARGRRKLTGRFRRLADEPADYLKPIRDAERIDRFRRAIQVRAGEYESRAAEFSIDPVTLPIASDILIADRDREYHHSTIVSQEIVEPLHFLVWRNYRDFAPGGPLRIIFRANRAHAMQTVDMFSYLDCEISVDVPQRSDDDNDVE